MATRGNRPKDPASTKGGVRGTHGLGDAPRDSDVHPVAVRGGSASPAGGTPKGGTAKDHRNVERASAPPPENDESTGEEREFELSNAMAELETADERAERREREARAALLDTAEATATEEEARLAADEREERAERGLETVRTPGPGPKDRNKGRARTKHLEDHGLKH